MSVSYEKLASRKSNCGAVSRSLLNKNKITFLADRHWIIPQLIPNKKINVLEVGGGSLFSYRFVLDNEIKDKINYYNYDLMPSPDSPDVHFIQYDEGQKQFPIRNELFDIIIAMDVIEHVKDTDIFINELKRVLKKDGAIILTTPNYSNLKFTLKYLFGRMAHNPLGSSIEKYTYNEHVKYFTSRDFYPYIESLGLACEANISHSLNVTESLIKSNIFIKLLLGVYNILPFISVRFSHTIIGVFRKKPYPIHFQIIKV